MANNSLKTLERRKKYDVEIKNFWDVEGTRDTIHILRFSKKQDREKIHELKISQN